MMKYAVSAGAVLLAGYWLLVVADRIRARRQFLAAIELALAEISADRGRGGRML